MIRWLLSLLRRRREHVPRAVRLALALPEPQPDFKEAFRNGAATLIGRCVTCEWPWTPAHGSRLGACRVPLSHPPPSMPIPGDGMPRS